MAAPYLFSTIPVPASAEYNAEHPHRQRENVAYCILHVLETFIGASIPDPGAVAADLHALAVELPLLRAEVQTLTAAVNDLAHINIVIDRGFERTDIFGRFHEEP